MRRLLATAVAAAALGAAAAPAAQAHPLGNFSVNHLTQVSVSRDRIDVRYLLDQAEIPTFQERGEARSAILAAKRAEVQRHLQVTADGRPLRLRAGPASRISFPAGQGGLRTTRVEIALSAEAAGARRVEVRDGTFPGRVGWKAVVARPGDGTAVRSTAPSGDPTRGLHAYPAGSLQSPSDLRTATLDVRPGPGTLVAPRAPGGPAEATTTDRGGDGFSQVFEEAAAGRGVLLFLLLAAFGWGALHALSPGHGKAMVAAYLVGTRGTARHAVALGGVTTVTHTIGVFALGLVTLLLSQYILPEDLYPWLNLASGLLVVAIGLGVLRSRIGWYRARRAGATAGASDARGHGHAHSHGHGHGHHHHHGRHDHDHDPGHHDHHGHHHGHAPAERPTGPRRRLRGLRARVGHGHGHGPDGHSHRHDLPEDITWKGLVGMGAAAGLIPCPTALVVLLGAIAQHQVGLGLVLIVAFSLGLASTLVVLGLGVVWAGGRLTARVSFSGRAAAALPAASAVVIVGAGALLTLSAMPQL